jgi:transposase
MQRTNKKFEVHLEPGVRKELDGIWRKGTGPASKARRARILLLCDEDHQDGQRPDWQVAEIVGVSERTVVRVRQDFVREGLSKALVRKRRLEPPTPPKLDGRAEAQLVTLCCSTPPRGRKRWTLQLLVDELCRLQVVTAVCRETVRRRLKKIVSSRGRRNGSAFRRETAPDLWRTWRKSSTYTAGRTMHNTR